jgi:hypothetical protein
MNAPKDKKQERAFEWREADWLSRFVLNRATEPPYVIAAQVYQHLGVKYSPDEITSIYHRAYDR